MKYLKLSTLIKKESNKNTKTIRKHIIKQRKLFNLSQIILSRILIDCNYIENYKKETANIKCNLTLNRLVRRFNSILLKDLSYFETMVLLRCLQVFEKSRKRIIRIKICKNNKTHIYKNLDRCPTCKKQVDRRYEQKYKSEIKQKRILNKENIKQYQMLNKEHIKKVTKKRITNNPIKYKEQLKKYRNSRKEYYKMSKIKWRKDHPGRANEISRRRRCSKIQRTPKWLTLLDKQYIKHIYIQSGELTKITGILHHVDHIIPLQGETVCGLHVPWNLQIITAIENAKKGNALII